MTIFIFDHVLLWLNILALCVVAAACFKFNELNWDTAHWVVRIAVILVILAAILSIADELSTRATPTLATTLFNVAIAGIIVLRTWFPDLLRGVPRKADHFRWLPWRGPHPH